MTAHLGSDALVCPPERKVRTYTSNWHPEGNGNPQFDAIHQRKDLLMNERVRAFPMSGIQKRIDFYRTSRTGIGPPATGGFVGAGPQPTTLVTIPTTVLLLLPRPRVMANCRKPIIVTGLQAPPGHGSFPSKIGTLTIESLRVMLVVPWSAGLGLLLPPSMRRGGNP